MSRTGLALAVLVALGCLVPVVGGAAVDAGADRGPQPDRAPERTAAVVAVYPNPVADRDRGEFVVLDLPAADAEYRLGDGRTTARLPNGTAGRVVVTDAPALVRNLTDERVVGVDPMPTLANGGDELTLRRGDEAVATVRYHDAPEGDVGWYDDRGAISWRPVGATDRPVVTAEGGTVRAFVLPDAPEVAAETIRGADERVLLAGYTFASGRVARALERAADRGVAVRVLLEGAPVDGLSRREARLLDSLVDAGVDVRMLGGARDRYAYHHAKYAVVDDRALVLTENWKPAGTGGASSRGWGVTVSQPAVVAGLADTFRADADWAGARPWERYRMGRSFHRGSTANGSYPRERAPERLPVERTRLLVTPDNAGPEVTGLLDGADESIDVVQLSIDGPDQRFLRAAVRAAERGVRVRVLLSDAWYVREENRQVVEWLRERAAARDLPIEARLADPEGRYEKVHAKGVVVDGDEVLVGSLNWNDASVQENREVLVHLRGEAVGSYYREAFEADWRASADESFGGDGAVEGLPVGSIAAVAGVVVLAVLVARRVDFGDDIGVGRP